jgi:hypothetical protein
MRKKSASAALDKLDGGRSGSVESRRGPGMNS